MTRKPTYREKGRAVFLAALMVLSVVAMSASFAGAAAAVNEETYDEGPTFEDGTIDKVWIGQEITLVDSDNSQDGQFVSIAEGPEVQDDPDTVSGTTTEVDGDTVTLETEDLEDGNVYHIYAHGDNKEEYDFHGEAFRAQVEDLEIEFSTDTVTEEGTVNLEINSERDGQHLNVTSDELDAEELENIFGSEHAHPTDTDDAILLQNVDDGDEIEANFTDASVDPGEYEFEFSVTDSLAEDNATLEVLDESEEFNFADVDQIEEGGIANVTLSVDHADEAAVVFGDDDDGHITEFTVDIEDGDKEEVVLQFNSHTAADEDENYGWSAYDDDNVTINDVAGDTELGENEPLPSYNWDLSVGDSLTGEDDDYELENEHDRDVLVIKDSSAVGEASTHVAPTTENINNFEDYEDATVTETDTLANEDNLFLVVEDYGAEGAVESGYDEGVYIEIEEQDSGPIGDASTWNSSDELDVELVNQDDYNGDLIYQINYQSLDDLEVGNSYDVRFNVTDENAYVDDEDEEIGQELELSLEERDVEWDAIASLPAHENATATGTTNVAPGTELDATADSPNDQGSFVEFTDAEVTAGDDGAHEFTATFDLSEEEPGVLFDLIVEDPYSDASDEVEDVELTEDDVTVATFEVDADAPSSVEPGDDATLDVTVENVGDLEGTSNFSVVIDGEQIAEGELELNSSESVSKSYEFDTSDEGEIEWEVATDHDDASGTLSVMEETENGGTDNGGTDNGGTDNGGADNGGEDDDGTPGFGVAVAALALLASAMLALRQQH